jgi:hypothetical protein
VITAFSVYIWLKWWKVGIVPLYDMREWSQSDFLLSVTISVEFFQLAGLGPDFRSLNKFVRMVADALTVNLDAFIDLDQGFFWVILY